MSVPYWLASSVNDFVIFIANGKISVVLQYKLEVPRLALAYDRCVRGIIVLQQTLGIVTLAKDNVKRLEHSLLICGIIGAA